MTNPEEPQEPTANSHKPRSKHLAVRAFAQGALQLLFTIGRTARGVLHFARTRLRVPIVIATALLSGILFYLLSRRVYLGLSPFWLTVIPIARHILTVAAALLGIAIFKEGTDAPPGRKLFLAAAIIVAAVAIFDRAPTYSPGETEVITAFTSSHGGVKVSPDFVSLDRAKRLVAGTDPLLLAQDAIGQGKLDEALRLLEKSLLDMEPMERVIAETHTYKGLALLRLRRTAEALRQTELALTISPDYVPALIQRCKAFSLMNNFGEALGACNRAIALNTDDPSAWGEKGAALLRQADRELQDKAPLYEEALAALEVSLKARPNDPAVLDNKAVALLRLGRLQEGLEVADIALKIAPEFSDALLNKAVILKRMKRFDEAIAIYRRLTTMNAHDPEAWSDLGSALVARGKQGDLDDALIAYNAATQSAPDFGDAWFNKGQVLNLKGRYKEALEALDKAIGLNPYDEEALVEKATALEHLGRFSEAVDAVTQALKKKPSDPDAIKLKQRLTAAHSH